MPSILSWLKSQPVLVVSAAAALLSMVAVPPNPGYSAYFNWHTLLCLFAMLAVLNGFRQVGAFRVLAGVLVRRFSSLRSVTLVLVMITFFGSMFLTNDMALLTFLPLTALILSAVDKQDRILFTFVMETLAANLGGMILPFGNPQNLFLFSYYQLNLVDFVSVLALPFLVSFVLIVLCCVLMTKNEPLAIPVREADGFQQKEFLLFLGLFALVIAMVFNFVPSIAGSLVVTGVMLALGHRQALAHVDYALLATFACFFVFSGNLAAVPAVQEVLSHVLEHGAFLPSVLACQVISNVPTAILLAPFTQDWAGLLLGVDIGGAGTVVASLASLITMAEYGRCMPGNQGRFLLVFSLYNVAFLGILVAFALFVL